MQAVISYRSLRKYKYGLLKAYQQELELEPGTWGYADTVAERAAPFLALAPIEGTSRVKLTIYKGYAWDGPSGPTWDTENFMRGSLVHDALYQLLRAGVLPQSARRYADDLLREMCLSDGMSRLRAWWVWRALRWFGGRAAKLDKKEVA